MKKSLLALAAMGAFAGAAHAQSSVTVYGILDLGVTSHLTTMPQTPSGKQLLLEAVLTQLSDLVLAVRKIWAKACVLHLTLKWA